MAINFQLTSLPAAYAFLLYENMFPFIVNLNPRDLLKVTSLNDEMEPAILKLQ